MFVADVYCLGKKLASTFSDFKAALQFLKLKIYFDEMMSWVLAIVP
jgi:hypothetical protein